MIIQMNIDPSFITKEILKYNPSHLIIGYSGGIDSSVLLDICSNINLPVIAIYINHNIHRDADNWQEHCKGKCDDLNIKFISYKLAQAPKGESFEAWASKQRMAFFQTEMANYSNPLLLLGHHQDDQAETFLIQAIRGAGLAGLAGIPKYKKLELGAVMRPLLKHTKIEIENYAKLYNISSIYDDSNEDIKYRRNLIRNQVLPILESINPSISKTLARSANICAKSNNLLTTLLNKELKNITIENNILIDKLISLDEELQQSLLHLWFKNITTIGLKHNQIKDIYISLNNPKTSTGWQIDVNLNYSLYLEYGLLKIKTTLININSKANDETILKWLKEMLDSSINVDTNKLIIRDRLGTDRCRYIGRNRSTKLKTLFQEIQISEKERKNIKIVELDQKIIAVYPFFICDIS